jgi:hypothetical protein
MPPKKRRAAPETGQAPSFETELEQARLAGLVSAPLLTREREEAEKEKRGASACAGTPDFSDAPSRGAGAVVTESSRPSQPGGRATEAPREELPLDRATLEQLEQEKEQRMALQALVERLTRALGDETARHAMTRVSLAQVEEVVRLQIVALHAQGEMLRSTGAALAALSSDGPPVCVVATRCDATPALGA